jgi:hypothetical protein
MYKKQLNLMKNILKQEKNQQKIPKLVNVIRSKNFKWNGAYILESLSRLVSEVKVEFDLMNIKFSESNSWKTIRYLYIISGEVKRNRFSLQY